MDKKSMRRKNLLYRLRKKGVKVNTRERCVYLPYGSEPDNIDHIDENLQNVKAVDAYAALAAHTDEDIYARTDHHWLPLGAYYAAEAFAKTAGVNFAPLSSYTKTTLSGYLGSMYTFTKSAVLQENPEDFTYYTPHNQYTTQ